MGDCSNLGGEEMNARDNDAKAIRNIRKILRGNMPIETPDELEESPGIIRSAFIVIGCIILASLLMIASCQTAHAQEFSDVQIVIERQLAKHCFNNMKLASTSEAYGRYRAEGIDIRITKSVHKSGKGTHARACGSGRSKYCKKKGDT